MFPGLNQGKLEKMVIWAYEVDSSTNKPVQLSQAEEDKYKVLLNPEGYSLNQMILRDMRQGLGTSGSEAPFLGNAPSNFTFKLLFDATGALPKPAEGPLSGVPIVGAIADAIAGGDDEYKVMTEIEKFNQVVYQYDPDNHGPRLVSICWGDLIIEFASLQNVNFEFKLFSPDGTPLRAYAEATFVESPPNEEREASTQSFSPDVTKIHTVKAGDSLPQLAERYYQKSSLYIEIARVNQLINFRSLEPGTRLIIPSIDKSGA